MIAFFNNLPSPLCLCPCPPPSFFPTSTALPIFTKVPMDLTGVSGGAVSFVCQATGDPKPKVTWNKKGKRVNSPRVESIEFDEGAGAVLRIQPLRAPRDENIYECVAENIVGEITTSAKLSIIREDLLPQGFPRIDMGPQLKVVERTRTATMLCAASGVPDPEISWFKDLLPIDPSASSGRIKQLRSEIPQTAGVRGWGVPLRGDETRREAVDDLLMWRPSFAVFGPGRLSPWVQLRRCVSVCESF
ncbi:hypothetical protein ACEWY4_014912 [Coilia grayii]|uniref:Ig-like domain-containing protein n=1 Tax=Coilia grayii TaxID=363190 RepID=A0ABD1JTL8_9TELE